MNAEWNSSPFCSCLRFTVKYPNFEFWKKHFVYKNAENYNSFVFKDSDTISDFVYTLSEPYDGGILEKKIFTKKVW
jgi:hypothetical protein